MALPLAYNFESVRVRWLSALVAILGIAGAVGIFVAMLALASGFQAALVRSGSPRNALLRRTGATAEIDSALRVQEVRVIEDAPEVARDSQGALSSPEIVVLAALPLRGTDADANVQVRGVAPRAFDVHELKIVAGRRIARGLPELLVGKHATTSYRGLGLGESVVLGGTTFSVVGVFDAGGSAFDSELWADSDVLGPTYQRPLGVLQTVVVRLSSEAALDGLRKRLGSDPRLHVQVDRETEYYAKASQVMSDLILGLGSLVAAIMGIGAVFAALNTMYSAVAERSREIATIRALGFGAGPVLLSFLIESCLVASAGGVLGCLIVVPLNGLATSTLNFQTFSHLAFAFQVTPALLGIGFGFGLLMGVLGGLPPAVRAARLPVAAALRDL